MSENFALRIPLPAENKEIPSKILVLPVPFDPIIATGPIEGSKEKSI